MWMLPARWLCDDHLLGEHSEMHQAAGTIANHPHGEAVVRGHAEKGNLETALIEVRHAQVSVEMELRGMNHDSPLQDFDDPGVGRIGGDDVRRNLGDLCRRCVDCRARVAADEYRRYRLGSRTRFAELHKR
jgi:hypothetical protein